MSRLTELQDKRNADERFLTHREEQELLRLQVAEIERLRDTEKRLLEHLDAKTGDCVQDEQWDDIWHLVHPDDSSWEYPGQVIRELRYFVQRLRAERDEAREAARLIWRDLGPDMIDTPNNDLIDPAETWPWLEEGSPCSDE